MEADGAEDIGPVAIGAKGTIVSLMEKELQLEEEASFKGIRILGNPGTQIHHLPIRNEVVSAYCGTVLISNMKCSKDYLPSAATGHKKLTKASSYKDTHGSTSTLLTLRPFQRSSSLNEPHSFSSPKSFRPRKKVVSYLDSAYSGMLAFMDSEEKHHGPSGKRPSRPDDSSIPILPDISCKNSSCLVDTRCYYTGRDPFAKVSGGHKKFGFWRL